MNVGVGRHGPLSQLQSLLAANPNGLTQDQVAQASSLASQAAQEFLDSANACNQAIATAKASHGVSVPVALGLSVGSALLGGLIERALDHAIPRKR